MGASLAIREAPIYLSMSIIEYLNIDLTSISRESLANLKHNLECDISWEENLIHQSPASSERSKDLLIQYNSFLEKIMEKISRV